MTAGRPAGARVLVIEDDEPTRLALTRELSARG